MSPSLPESSVVEVGNLRLDLVRREASIKQKPVCLTTREFAVLDLLVTNKGLPLTKAHFLSYLYEGVNTPSPMIIDVLICRLRRKLTRAGVANIIDTIRDHGYMIRKPRFDDSYDSPVPTIHARELQAAA